MTTSDRPSSNSPSVRPSLDAPRQLDPNQVQALPKRNNRAALRDYYKLKPRQPLVNTPPSRTSSTSSTTTTTNTTTTAANNDPAGPTTDPLDTIDDHDFHPESYITSLLQTSSLSSLLKTESTLVSEIRHLDGERKALVYDNYSKLIGATEMIARMVGGLDADESRGGSDLMVKTLVMMERQTGTAGFEEKRGGLKEVERVRGLLEQIGLQAAALGSRSDVQRDPAAITPGERRRSERAKRETVEWVLNGPARLAALSLQGQDAQVRGEWTRVQEVLDRWKGVEGVEEVRTGCQDVINALDRREAEDTGAE